MRVLQGNLTSRALQCSEVGVDCIGVDLAGILGERMTMAEGGLVPSGVWYGEGYVSPLQPTRGSAWEPRPKTDFGVF